MLKNELRVLHLEDTPADVELVDHALTYGGLTFRSTHVDNEEAFLHELEHHPPDVILSDHGLPSFDGFTALAIARQKCPDVPFIFVTGSLGEQFAIQTFENGATDYVLKDRLDHLVPAVRRALLAAEDRQVRKMTEAEREHLIDELQEALARVQALREVLPICSHCKRIRDEQNHWKSPEAFLEELFRVRFSHGLCPDCIPRFFPNHRNDGR